MTIAAFVGRSPCVSFRDATVPAFEIVFRAQARREVECQVL